MPALEILPYHPDEDREAVEAIMRVGLRDQETLATALTPAENVGFFDEWWRRLTIALDSEPEGCWIAANGDEVVGFMWTAIVRQWPLPHMSVDQLAVLPARRGQGVGGKLLEQAIFLARSRPLPLVLGGLANNPSQRLYRRMGWVDVPDALRDDRNPNHFWLWWKGSEAAGRDTHAGR